MADAYVQSTTATTGGVQGVFASAAYPSNNTAGNFLVCYVRAYSVSTTPIAPPTDTQGNAWVLAYTFRNATVANIMVYFAPDCKGGANTVTVTTGYSAYIRCVMAEYSGVGRGINNGGAFAFQANASSFGTAASSGNITTSATGLLLGLVENDTNGAVVISLGGTWTQRQIIDGLVLADTIVQPAGTYAMTATYASSVLWSCSIMEFNDLAAAAPSGGHQSIVC
jgi:hypothetical protein